MFHSRLSGYASRASVASQAWIESPLMEIDEVHGVCATQSSSQAMGTIGGGGGSQFLRDHHGYLLRMRMEGGLEGIALGPLLGKGSYGRVYKGACFHCHFICLLLLPVACVTIPVLPVTLTSGGCTIRSCDM